MAFTGYVADFPQDLIGRRGEVISLITLDSVRTAEPQCFHIGKISALLIHQGDATANVSLGDVVTGIARFSNTDHQWVFGRFPNNLKDLTEGIRGRLIIRQISGIDSEQRSMLSRLRSRLNDNLSQWSTTDRTARFLQALLLGRQDRLMEGDWHQLKALGISHALVVSGLHVGLVTLWIGALVSLPRRLLALTPTVRNNLVERIIVCAGSYAYVALTGMSLPAERAFLMITIATLATPIIWSVHPMAVISLVAALLLMKNPLSGLTASFWLSLVMTGIILFHQTDSQRSWRSWVKLHVIVALSSSILSVVFFAQTTTVGLIANSVFVPFITSVVLPLGLIAMLLSAANQFIGETTITAVSSVLDGLLRAVDGVLAVENTEFLQSIWFHPAILVVPFFVLASWLHKGGPRVAIVCGLSLLLTGSLPPKNIFKLSVFDVGQGTMLMGRSDDSVMVYDAGGLSFTGRAVVERGPIRWLRQQGVSDIDVLIVSHGDEDHAGGLSAVKSQFNVKEHYGYGGLPCRPGMRLKTLPSVRLTILSGTGQSQQHRNDDSCALQLQFGNRTILLPGDISRAIELDLVAYDLVERPVHLLTAAHHGSSSSSSATFVDAIGAGAVIFTTSLNNQFGHPHPDVFHRFKSRGVEILNTATDGSIGFVMRPGMPVSATPLRNSFSPYWTTIPGHKIRLAD